MLYRIKQNLLFIVPVTFLITGCSEAWSRKKEAREDAKEFELAISGYDKIHHKIGVDAETAPVGMSGPSEDAADDPAIWYNSQDPEMSVVFGSNKKAGIHSYSLGGSELQFIPVGAVNNIDIRQGLGDTKEQRLDILGGSMRGHNSLVFFFVDSVGEVSDEPDFYLPLGDYEPYGFCLGLDKLNELRAFVNNKAGEIRCYRIHLSETKVTDASLEGSFHVSTQPEGMVSDDEGQRLFVGEEEKGIHVFDLNNLGQSIEKTSFIIKDSGAKNNPNIRYDIEGLAYFEWDNKNYLLASSQGNFTYALFEAGDDPKYLLSFGTTDNNDLDRAEETDGLEVMTNDLGQPYSSGIIVLQDGFNYDDGQLGSQNFKYVGLEKLMTLVTSK